MINRRHFLQCSSLISLASWIPTFLPVSVRADDAKEDDRILVVIQLDGGNDGLNTVIPFADENYAKLRRELKIKPQSVHKLSDSLGLHPAMKDAGELYKEGLLTIVQGVGYPNPNRSHFDSMSIWHRANTDEQSTSPEGWLGRAVDSVPKRNLSIADSVFIGDSSIPVALRGRRANAISLEQESDLALVSTASKSPVLAQENDLLQFVTRTQAQTLDAAQRLELMERKNVAVATYPTTQLARHLQLISKLIKLRDGTRIYYASQSGYDTHSQQANTHRRLLSEFNGALSAFVRDLKAADLLDRVIVMAFSEFGRRVEENGSAGTDHGAAGPVFLAGSSLRGGLVGDHPSLTDLVQGDLNMSVDFRSIYAALLTNWLGIPAAPVLGDGYVPLELFKA